MYGIGNPKISSTTRFAVADFWRGLGVPIPSRLDGAINQVEMAKAQRVRDPVHNLIEFSSGEFEQLCWRLLQSRPMQRLRRVKQLGFSEFIYPGASHTRLSHCLGVFHTARQLANVLVRQLGQDRYDRHEAQVAMAAALVHDIGHGPFSHAFEDALKKLELGKKHELRTRGLLLETDAMGCFDDFPEYPDEISNLIESEFPRTVYASIVSSQFDADRLDYMRRDRMMSGTQQSAIDFDWLLANMEVGRVSIDQDGKFVRKADTFVLNEKALLAAEGYIFSLLYLYKNVYYHKTTRGLEKIFSALVLRIADLVRGESVNKIGLPHNHPLVRFLAEPENIEHFLCLDDTVILGALSLLSEAEDPGIRELASRIRDRNIYRAFDVTRIMTAKFGLASPGDRPDAAPEKAAEVERRVAKVAEMAIERGLLDNFEDGVPTILEDTAPRNPYKRHDKSRLFSRIHVVAADGSLHDLAEMSPAVNALSGYSAYRLYARSDSDARKVDAVIQEACQ